MAMCFLSVLATALIVSFFLISEFGYDASQDDVTTANAVGDGGAVATDPSYPEARKTELFVFDPNTADSTAFLRLGLQRWMIRNIYKYRAAGGVYRTKEDFARIYGLTKKQYEALAPYISISDDYRPASEFYHADYSGSTPSYGERGSSAIPRDTTQYPYKLKSGESIPLNTADTTTLKKVPGIGSAFARAIVRRRDRLGGFYSREQLLEIDGFPADALPYMKVDASSLRKISVNSLTYSQLRQHPYINFYQARDILDYRRLNGKVKSLSDLRLLKSFSPDDLKRLKPYLDFK